MTSQQDPKPRSSQQSQAASVNSESKAFNLLVSLEAKPEVKKELTRYEVFRRVSESDLKLRVR